MTADQQAGPVPSPLDSPRARARYYDPENFFAFAPQPVPRRQFVAERDVALDPETESGEVLLDASDLLETDYAATTPLLLARYLVLRPGETWKIARQASAEIFHVLRGAGQSLGAGELLGWRPGDTFCLPGGIIEHTADEALDSPAVLFSVCNEPLLRYEDLAPGATGHSRVSPVHWPWEDVDRRLAPVLARPDSAENAGRALQLASAAMAPARHPVPTMNVAINTLEPGADQKSHRHNGAAITLALGGEGVYSLIEDERIDWAYGAAQVTPAAELHSHHNRGTERMVSLVIEDEGLHFYTRTPGFSWT